MNAGGRPATLETLAGTARLGSYVPSGSSPKNRTTERCGTERHANPLPTLHFLNFRNRRAVGGTERNASTCGNIEGTFKGGGGEGCRWGD